MSVGLTRATVLAIKRESTPGTYVAPTAGTDYIALRPGNELSFEPELLESDELLNDIGASKAAIGKEVTNGKHVAYLRHSGTEGTEPQLGLLFESVFGSKNVNATEYDTVSSSTTKILKVNTGEGALFRAGQAVLVKNGNGYEIRNVNTISGDDLTLNFKLTNAPAAGVNLGKAIQYIPASSGHPTFSTTKNVGNGHAKECSAGNTITSLGITADANGYGEMEFAFEGTKYLFNPIVIGATNKYLDVTDDGGTFAVTVAEGVYKTPVELADALQAALEAASAETYTVTYSSTDGKFTIASGSTVLSLLWNTGTNAANNIGTTLGFSVAANDTLAVTYTSDNAQTYAAAYTPSYDSGDLIVLKGAELLVGTQEDNVKLITQSAKIQVAKEVEDVDDMCESTGVSEKIPTARTAEMTVTMALKKYDAALLDAMLKNTGIGAMLNAGPKLGGNWVPGKCFNFYMQTCTVGKYKTTGDSFVQVEMLLKGYVTSTTKDVFANFI